MQATLSDLAAVAPTHSTVLLTGETGCGKGVAARTLHELSRQKERPFVHADCASLPDSTIDSELFGHERGAFTGAAGRRAGRFERARDGTIFLDEIGELDLSLQRKLLRVLQDREFERLGGAQPIAMQARVIAATNRDLLGAVRAGRFRSDLFFRLNVVHIELPPLRDRLEDIPALVESGVEKLCRQLQRPVPVIGESFLTQLELYSWPGNVRELLNVLERVLVTTAAPARLDASHLRWLSPKECVAGEAQPDADASEDDHAETSRLARVLREAGGNVSRAARRLGIPRTTLRYRIGKLGLEDLLPND